MNIGPLKLASTTVSQIDIKGPGKIVIHPRFFLKLYVMKKALGDRDLLFELREKMLILKSTTLRIWSVVFN